MYTESRCICTYGEFEISFVQSSGLLFANPETDGRDGESLLLILNTLLGLWGFGTSPFSHFGSTSEITFHLDLMGEFRAHFTKVKFRVDLDQQVFGEETFEENNEFLAVGPVGTVHLSTEFNADIVLDLGKWTLHNVFTDGDKGWNIFWKFGSSFLGSLTGSDTEVEFSTGHGDFPEVVDGGFSTLGNNQLHSTGGHDVLDGILLSDHGNGVDSLVCTKL